MFDNIFAAIEKWMRELLSGMVESNLSTMFTGKDRTILMTASRSKRKRTQTHYRHHNTLFPKCLTGDCLNRNAGTIRLCVMPQGDKFQGVKTQER